MEVRNPKEEEFEAIYAFVSKCKPLENYSVHFYRIMLRYFRNTCFIAAREAKIAGFLLGFISQAQEDTFFLWQIGIDPGMQGQGLGQRFLEAVETDIRNQGLKRIELTIDPENKPSQRLFEKSGYSIISRDEGEVVEAGSKQAVKDYYGPGRHFILYEKRL